MTTRIGDHSFQPFAIRYQDDLRHLSAHHLVAAWRRYWQQYNWYANLATYVSFIGNSKGE